MFVHFDGLRRFPGSKRLCRFAAKTASYDSTDPDFILLIRAGSLYVLMFFMPYALMPEVSSELYVYGVVQTVNGISATELSFWPLAVLCGLVILVTGITIFLFRNRTVQMRVSINLMIVMAVSSVFMWFNAYQLGPEHIVYRLPSRFPALAILLTFMAWHGIPG